MNKLQFEIFLQKRARNKEQKEQKGYNLLETKGLQLRKNSASTTFQFQFQFQDLECQSFDSDTNSKT